MSAQYALRYLLFELKKLDFDKKNYEFSIEKLLFMAENGDIEPKLVIFDQQTAGL